MRVTLAILALVAGLCWALPARAADPTSATPAQLAALQEILARPEFQAAAGRSLLDSIRARVRELWRQFVARVLGLALEAGGGVIVYGTIAVGLVIVLGAGVLLYRFARGSVAGDATLAAGSLSRSPRAADELARARELAQAGQPRRALHHHYRAVLLRLDERDHLPLDSALTNRELLPRLTAPPDVAGSFAELVARFDRLWYGQTDCTVDEYAAFARLADRVWQGAVAS